MDNTEQSSIASRYNSLTSIRETFLERARESSELTLPFLVPIIRFPFSKISNSVTSNTNSSFAFIEKHIKKLKIKNKKKVLKLFFIQSI